MRVIIVLWNYFCLNFNIITFCSLKWVSSVIKSLFIYSELKKEGDNIYSEILDLKPYFLAL
jgi:hypothetical protein